jgi:hypothetical protein
MPTNAISAQFLPAGTGSPQWFVCTKEHDYCLYRKQSFTELTVGCEFDGPDGWNTTSMTVFHNAVERFLEIYRAVTRDVSVRMLNTVDRNYPIIRQAVSIYGGPVDKREPHERLIEAIPSRFEPVVFSVREFAIDAPKEPGDRETLTRQVGHHLATGMSVSISQSALLDCFEVVRTTKRFRYGVIEAFSIAEVEGFDLLSDVRTLDKLLDARMRNKSKKHRLTPQDLINSFLPRLLSEEIRSLPTLIANLDQLRKLRHRAVHERYTPSDTEADFALNTVQHFIDAVALRRSRLLQESRPS